MTVNPSHSLRQARTALIVVATCVLAVLVPAGAQAAGTTTGKILGIKIPASAKVHIATTTAPATSVPTGTTVPASTTPASATTSTSAPTGAGQPGTVAPPTTTPASAATQTASTATSTLPTTTPGSTTAIVAHKPKSSAKGLSAVALALALLGALLLLGCIVWGLGRWLALEPRWTISLTHSLREAAYRASETWAEFGDWARLGR
ncbi:MAG TPA: hypothetical protein VGP18_10455 [Solirubrobacteraceae bacterium]|nr:hypothetical protein [Solirubrobacteraceae bacterium]